MKIPTFVLVLVAAASTVAQESPRAPEKPPAQKAETGAMIPGLVKDLGSDDFKARSDATEKLRALGEKARPELEKAQKSANLEQRTRAGALLDELKNGAAGGDTESDGTPTRPLRPVNPEDGHTIEIRPGLRIELGEPPEIQELMKQLRELQGQGGIPAPGQQGFGPIRIFGGGPGNSIQWRGGSSGSFSRSITSDGETLEFNQDQKGAVRLRITKTDAKGAPSGPQESYEAPSMEEFKEKFPEIHEKYAAGGIFKGNVSTWVGAGDPNDPFDQVLRPAFPLENRATPRLGVTLEQVPESVRAQVEVPAKAVMIQAVTPRSAAEKIGLQAFDIVTRIDGAEVASAADAKRILEAHAAGKDVTIEVIRKGKAALFAGALP